MSVLEQFADDAFARDAFSRACGAERFVNEMLAARPFVDRTSLHNAAQRILRTFERADWLEAFAHHPKIGDVQGLQEKFANTRTWAASEQAGTNNATLATLNALADGNRAYEARFGYIFIVCATGKGADEMLALLRARLGNSADNELAIAAAEQTKITLLRLDKVVAA